MWIRTYGRLYQKLCSTTCEIPIGIYRTQDSHSETDEDYYEDSRVGSDGYPTGDNDNNFSSSDTLKRLSSLAQTNGGGGGDGDHNSKMARYAQCCRGACGSDQSSFTSAAFEFTDESRDSHAQLIERAEIANLVRSRMQGLGIPLGDFDQAQTSEKRSSLSYVIINPSCDLKIKSKFSASLTPIITCFLLHHTILMRYTF